MTTEAKKPLVPIKRFLDKVPGGLMLVPLILGCLVKTLFPGVLAIGGYTTGLTQVNPMLGMFFVICGANMRFNEAPAALKKGVVITLTKFIVSIAMGLAVAKLFGDNLFGLSSVAIIAAMSNSNGGLYLALCGEYGDRTDLGAYVVTAINDGPFFTMLAMGTAGIASIPFESLLSCVIPLIIGLVLGNLDHELRDFLELGYEKIIPFMGFALGTGLTFEMLIKGGLAGILLGIMTCFIGGVFLIIADVLTGGTGVAGAALSSTAGNAVSVPGTVAEADPSLTAAAAIATPQVAASTITTAILTPILTSWWAKNRTKFIKKK